MSVELKTKSFLRAGMTVSSHNTDFADKDKLIELLKEHFGDDRVIPISNFNTLKLNSLIRDLSRFFGVPFGDVNKVMKRADEDVKKKLLTRGVDKNTFEMTYEMAMEHSPIFKQFIDDNPEMSSHVNILLKQNKTVGRHAGGVIVADDIVNSMPLLKVRGELQTPWVEGLHFKHLEHFGWIKYDCLILKTLRIITRCIELVLESEGENDPPFSSVNEWFMKNLHPSALDMEDEHVFKHVYGQGRWAGIFQCIDGNTLVAMGDGNLKLLRDIQVGDRVLCRDSGRYGELVSSRVSEIFDNGVQECIQLNFDNGQVLACTPDHMIMTHNRGWVEAGDLTNDDDVVELDKWDSFFHST